MTYDRILELAGNWAAILTALVAVVAYGGYRWERHEKRRRLERLLHEEKGVVGTDRGRLSILELMSRLRMSESDVLDAAFRSRRVRCVAPFDYGRVPLLHFEYDDDELGAPPPGKARF